LQIGLCGIGFSFAGSWWAALGHHGTCRQHENNEYTLDLSQHEELLLFLDID
jgi:hypothetical protein